MTNNILNWAEASNILNDRKPLVQMSYLMTEVGRLANAVNVCDPDAVSQALAETHINLVILSELCSIKFDEALVKGFNKGEEETLNNAQLIAALRDTNVRSQKLIIAQESKIEKLEEAIDKYEKRTVYYEEDNRQFAGSSSGTVTHQPRAREDRREPRRAAEDSAKTKD